MTAVIRCHPGAPLNRDGREFHDRAGLRHIIETAGWPPLDKVPYRVMDRFDTA
jgi:hypothetical protein